MSECQYLCVGVDKEGGVWTYTFPKLQDALDFVKAVDDGDWYWDVRATDDCLSLNDALVFHKSALNIGNNATHEGNCDE